VVSPPNEYAWLRRAKAAMTHTSWEIRSTVGTSGGRGRWRFIRLIYVGEAGGQ